jgi:hypothetical protein
MIGRESVDYVLYTLSGLVGEVVNSVVDGGR